MPIINGNIQYTIPTHIKKQLTKQFCWDMLHELHMIFGLSAEDTALDVLVNLESTSGWAVALATTCRKHNRHELYKYYVFLDWYDSDLFDDQLSTLMAEYKLVLPDTETDMVARNNNLKTEELSFCEKCYKYYKESETQRVYESDESEYFETVCLSCLGTDKAVELTWNKQNTIKELLDTNEEVFLCPVCGKYHHARNKGKNSCLFCEIDRAENKSVNNYYISELSEQERYQKILKSKE